MVAEPRPARLKGSAKDLVAVGAAGGAGLEFPFGQLFFPVGHPATVARPFVAGELVDGADRGKGHCRLPSHPRPTPQNRSPVLGL